MSAAAVCLVAGWYVELESLIMIGGSGLVYSAWPLCYRLTELQFTPYNFRIERSQPKLPEGRKDCRFLECLFAE